MSVEQLQQRETREGKKLQPPLWLACVALAYPVYWSMPFLQRAVPAFAGMTIELEESLYFTPACTDSA